jgi:poly-gamma-glutamate synthesis protein (capsule biosynthesis protein)
MRYYIQRHSHKIAKTLLGLVVIFALILGAKYVLANKGEIDKIDNQDTMNKAAQTEVISTRVLASGNVAWGGRLYELSEASPLKAAYPFSGLNSLSRNEYDAWIGNLTCSLTTKPEPSSAACPSTYLTEARKWFTLFALGNANTNDSTRTSLEAAGIDYVGDQDIGAVSELCKVVSMPARTRQLDGSYKSARLPLIVCSINASGAVPDKMQYERVKKLAEVLPVWVYVYMGDSDILGQSELQKSVYRSFIEVGADMVIGNHPYAVQGAESYNGKLIVYSLGNFIQPSSSTDEERLKSVSLKIVASTEQDKNLVSWMSTLQACGSDTEVCLKDASSKELQKPLFDYELSLVMADSIKSGVTVRSSGTWEEVASKRLGWESLLPTLSYTKP